MKLSELTPEDLELRDSGAAVILTRSQAEGGFGYPAEERQAQYNAIKNHALSKLQRIKSSNQPDTSGNLSPSPPFVYDKATDKSVEITQEDITYFEMLHPQTTASDAERAELLQRLKNGNLEAPPDERDSLQIEEDQLDSFIYTAEKFLNDALPSLSENVWSHKVKTDEITLVRNHNLETGSVKVPETSRIAVYMRTYREGKQYWIVKYENLLDPDNKFYLYDATNHKTQMQYIHSGKEYELSKDQPKTSGKSPSKTWWQQSVGKVYEEAYDATYRVSVDLPYTQKPEGDTSAWMQTALTKGAELILDSAGKDSDERSINKIINKEDNQYENLIICLSYHLPVDGGTLKALVVAPIQQVDGLPDKDTKVGLRSVRVNEKVINNALDIAKEIDKRVKKYKGTTAPKWNKKTIDDHLEQIKKVYLDNLTPRDRYFYLFVDDNYKLQEAAGYHKIYKIGIVGQQPVTNFNKKQTSPHKDWSRTYWLLDRAYTKPTFNTTELEQLLTRFIQFPAIKLVPKQDKPKGAKKTPGKIHPPVKTAKMKAQENVIVQDKEKNAEKAEERRTEKDPSWWSEQFQMKKTKKQLSESHQYSKDKGFWDGTTETMYDYFWTKVDYNSIMMDALACLLQGQIGQSWRKLENDFNVLKEQWDEYSEWSENKSFLDQLKAVPEIFAPDDLPIDDISSEFIRSLREGVSNLINQLLLVAAQGLLDSIINFCERPNVDLPKPSERQAPLPFNFDRLKDLIDSIYDGLITADELSNLFEDLATQFSPLEICSLLEGNPDAYVVDRAMELVRLHCIHWIETEEQLIDFFESIGENLDLSVCDKIRALNDEIPIDEEDLCPPDRTLSENMLRRNGLTDEEIKRQLEDERKKRKQLAEELMNAINDGILSGNFVPPSVFCQVDEDGNVQKGTVSFFDDQFKFVLKETVESTFSATYNKFKSEGASFKNKLMFEEFTYLDVPAYTRTRSKNARSDHYPNDTILPSTFLPESQRDTHEFVLSTQIPGSIKMPVPYLVNFYKNPLIAQTNSELWYQTTLNFPFDFLAQLQEFSDLTSQLREDISNQGSADRGGDCTDEDAENQLQEAVDAVSRGIDANSTATKVIFEERYKNSIFERVEGIHCEDYGEGLKYNPETGQCECDEDRGYVPDPDREGKCIRRAEVEPPSNNIPSSRDTDRCEPPGPEEVVEPPPPPTPPPEPAEEPVEQVSQNPQIQYLLHVTGSASGNNNFPTTTYSYEKDVPQNILEYIESKNSDSYSPRNIFNLIMSDLVYSMTENRQDANTVANSLVGRLPTQGISGTDDTTYFFRNVKEAIFRGLTKILADEKGEGTSPLLKGTSNINRPPPENGSGNNATPLASKKTYVLEQINLGPEPSEVCDPHLLKIRQVLEEMFDELGDDMCFDFHAEQNPDSDGRPRLKPMEKIAMRAAIKITLRHYIIENITRGMITHSAFVKIGPELSDLKVEYILGKMKMAMDAYNPQYYNNFSKYAVQVYDGPKLTGGSLRQLVLSKMLKEEYAEISFNLHQAMFLGDIYTGQRSNKNLNFFANMFASQQSSDKIPHVVISREISRVERDEILRQIPDDPANANLARRRELIEDALDKLFDSQANIAQEENKLFSFKTPYRCIITRHKKEIFDNLSASNPVPQFIIEQEPHCAKLSLLVPDDYGQNGNISVIPQEFRDALSQIGVPDGEDYHQFKRVLFTTGVDNEFGKNRFYNEGMASRALYNLEKHIEDSDENSRYGFVIPLFKYNYSGYLRSENLIDAWTGDAIPHPTDGGSLSPAGTRFATELNGFREALGNNPEMKMLFEHCFPIKEYATLLNVHEMETNIKNIDIVSHFGGTRDALYAAFFAMTPQHESWKKEPQAISDMTAGLGLGMMGMFPGMINGIMDKNAQVLTLACTKMKWNFGLDVCWGNPFNGMGFEFIFKAALQAALMQLKSWIEKTDPNVKLAAKLAFLSQLACVDIPTTATSGIIHAAFPWMSTQFTALYNALGLGDLDSMLDSDTDSGQNTEELVEEAGLSLPNYCGIDGQAAGDLDLDEAAERGSVIERVAQLKLKEPEYRAEIAALNDEIFEKRQEEAVYVAEVTRQTEQLERFIANPFKGTAEAPEENFPDSKRYGIDTSRTASVESRQRYRDLRDEVRAEIVELETRRDFLREELNFLEQNR